MRTNEQSESTCRCGVNARSGREGRQPLGKSAKREIKNAKRVPGRGVNARSGREGQSPWARMPNGKHGPKRGRTADLYTASVALYQLSYRPGRNLGA